MSNPRGILTTLALVAAAMMVTASSASATSCPNTTTQAPGLSQEAMESSIACLVNEERTSRDLVPVTLNTILRQAGLAHSTEMVQDSYFDHTSPDGITFIDRIEGTGYIKNARTWVVGENLAWGTGQLSTPGALVDAWMNSPPHRENLLRARFREIGIAAVQGTPETTSDPDGIVVSSEYGYRAGKARKRKKAGKAGKAKVRHRKAQARR